MKRLPKSERAVSSRVEAVLSRMAAQFPRNPADTQMLFFYANRSHAIHRKLIASLNTIKAGPHVSYDYIEFAEDDMKGAEQLAEDMEKEAELITVERNKDKQIDLQHVGGVNVEHVMGEEFDLYEEGKHR